MRFSTFAFIFLIFFSSLLLPASGFTTTQNKQFTIATIAFDTQFLDTQQGLKSKLAQLGFHEGVNIHYLVYDLKKDLSSIPEIINALHQQNCDLILTITTPVTLAVQKALQGTKPIPVVFTMVADPLGSGIVHSLQKPGGNITGISYNAFAIIPKELELFREAFPQLQRIALIYNHSEDWLSNPVKKIVIPAANKLNFMITEYNVSNQLEMDLLLKSFDSKIQGIFMLPDPLVVSFFTDLVTLSRKYKLPMMVVDNTLLIKGGVMGYSPTFSAVGRQAGTMVNKILSQTPAGQLSVQRTRNLQLIISLREANLLGITMPAAFLRQSDRIIR